MYFRFNHAVIKSKNWYNGHQKVNAEGLVVRISAKSPLERVGRSSIKSMALAVQNHIGLRVFLCKTKPDKPNQKTNSASSTHKIVRDMGHNAIMG